ncbi:MAG: tRNA (adenosine(37)-N6)-threonylcarbamoyltransferase complex dimerization subunit type 1 TsaB [Cyanophyceae cyanobacterium]
MQPAPVVGLAIHTTGPQLGLAARWPDGTTADQVWDLGHQLSTDFHDYLQGFMGDRPWTILDYLAVATGPGGFTGTRIGVVAARTLAQQLRVPLFGVSSLAAAAWTYRDRAIEDGLALQMPARRGEYHVAFYQVSATQTPLPILNDCVMGLEDWKLWLEARDRPHGLVEVGDQLGKDARSVLDLAEQVWGQGDRRSWEATLPYYGQHPVDSPLGRPAIEPP